MRPEKSYEFNNLLVLFFTTLAALVLFIFPIHTGSIYFLARRVQKLQISLGMIPDDVIQPALPVLITNVLIFIASYIFWGFLAYTFLKRRKRSYSPFTYGILMPVFFLLIMFPYVLFYSNKASVPFSFIGTIIISLIQVPLSSLILKDTEK